MSMRSTSFFNFAISSHQLTCPIGQTCARGFSLQEKKKRTLPDSEAPFLKRCLPAFSKWLEANVADWMIFVQMTGLRCAEYAQKTQSGVDGHIYPSGK
jgi:hypothetical protein